MENALSSYLNGETGGSGAWDWPVRALSPSFLEDVSSLLHSSTSGPSPSLWCAGVLLDRLEGHFSPPSDLGLPLALGLDRRRFGLACGRWALDQVCLVHCCVHTRHQGVPTVC